MNPLCNTRNASFFPEFTEHGTTVKPRYTELGYNKHPGYNEQIFRSLEKYMG